MRGNYGQKPPSSTGSKAPTMERIIGGLCYMSAGLIGLLYIIVTGKSNQTNFFRFHFLQSIVLALIFFILQYTEGIILAILGASLSALGPEGPIQWLKKGFDIFLILLGLVPLYGMIFCFLGKYAQ